MNALFSIAHVYIYNSLLVIAWLAFSFLFWRHLRSMGTNEDHIFDLTFYVTLVFALSARIGFIATHWELFAGKSALLWAAIWVESGMSWFAGLIGSLIALYALSRAYKVRLGFVYDAFAMALFVPMIIGHAASLLFAPVTGKIAEHLPWAVVGRADSVPRHPVHIYALLMLVSMMIVFSLLWQKAQKKKWPYGLVGALFLIWYGIIRFVLEFTVEAHVYWIQLTANQWALIGIFLAGIGAWYTRGGGRQMLRPFIVRTRRFIEHISIRSRKKTEDA